MNQQSNKYIKAQYQLFDATDNHNELIEETSDERPFDFVSGLNMLLPEFEHQLESLHTGDHFDFLLAPEQAYGEYVDARVIDLDKQLFTVDGRFDAQHVHVDAIVPLQNAEGQRFNGRVVAVTDDKVKVDLNHPLAGMTLHFVGQVLESHDATGEEITQYLQVMTGQGGCGGSCESCGSGCHDEGHGEGHGEGGCCGHHGHGEGHGEGGCCGHHGHGEGHGEGGCCGHHGHGEGHGEGHCCGHHGHGEGHGEGGCCGHNH